MKKQNNAEENIAELSAALAAVKDGNLVNNFLHSLLTPSEIKDIAARWALIKALDQKVPQREIAKTLGLSLCKITRGSKEMKNPNEPFQKMLAVHRKNSNNKA